jgi:hypothetical protein
MSAGRKQFFLVLHLQFQMEMEFVSQPQEMNAAKEYNRMGGYTCGKKIWTGQA